MEFHHISVLLNECIDNLNITPDGIYVDGTMGGGGHSLEIAKRLTTGRLICIDQDPNAHEAAGKRLAEYKDRITFVRDNFGNIANILDSLGIEKIGRDAAGYQVFPRISWMKRSAVFLSAGCPVGYADESGQALQCV